ncbi:MAG: TIGR04086 family membrane protein [Clostridia bacterium]|nr:TIGR04086 family membrane protein [Clostridia bacterium]
MRSHKEESGWLRDWVRPVGWGGVVGAVGCLLMLLILAALLLSQDVPQTSVTPLSLVAAVAGAFLGGFTAGRVAGERGWLMGLLAGLLLFLMLLIAGGFALFRDVTGSHLLVKLSTMLVTAAVGGIVAVNVRRR